MGMWTGGALPFTQHGGAGGHGTGTWLQQSLNPQPCTALCAASTPVTSRAILGVGKTKRRPRTPGNGQHIFPVSELFI